MPRRIGVAIAGARMDADLVADTDDKIELKGSGILGAIKASGVEFILSVPDIVTSGGLVSYGPDLLDQYRRAAGYVDRILKSTKPADLPGETPTKYQLVINKKAAKTLGLTVSPTLLARADEVIE